MPNSTDQELHQAFLNFTTNYLNSPPEGGADAKIVEWVARYLEKKEFSSVSTPVDNSFEANAMDKIKAKHGVE